MEPVSPPGPATGPIPGPTLGPLAAGMLLDGRYRVRSRAGAGGMATIYLARDELLARDVAVKVLHAHLADDPALRERFRTEARHAAALHHPHVVAIFDQGGEELPYIVMEYVDGPSLREVLTERGRLEPGEALAVIAPICEALARAHEAGLVHRDVKPENVLVTSEGTPKVADFGIARALAESGQTQSGTVLGSVHYLAPELAHGAPAGPASDQYAVGVLLFELLTGRRPLTGETPMAVLLRHTQEGIPAPSSLRPELPPAGDAVVARATALEPTERYRDLRALADALREAVPGGAQPVAVPVQRNGAGEHTLVIPAERRDTVAVGAPARPREPAKRDKSNGPTRRARRGQRRRRWLRTSVLAVLVLGLLAAGVYGAWDRILAPPTEVPEVVGLSATAAAELLDEQGFAVEEAEPAHSREVPEGEVLTQEPAAGETRRRGATVTLVPSAGPATVPMPEVVGLSEEEALDELAVHVFEVRVDHSHHDTVPEGTVLAQRPEPETDVREGEEVIINVSLGIEQIAVPDLSGLDREEAAATLREARLTATFSAEYSDEVPERDAVIRQSPEPDTEIDKGAAVEVVISRGPLTFGMPDVEGDPVDEARALLEGEGLEVRVVEQPRPQVGPFRRGRFDRVEYQEPQPGEDVQRGDQVTLYTFTQDAEERDD